MRRLTRLLAGIALGAVFGVGAAFAGDLTRKGAAQDDGFAAWSAVSEEELGEQRGTGAIVGINVLHQTVTLEGNQTGDSGDIDIMGDPFLGVTGIVAVLMNTGNNVAMGNEFIINVYIE